MLFTKVLITKENIYQISQIQENCGNFFLTEYPDIKTSRISFSSVKKDINLIQSKGIKTKNGYLLLISDRLENSYNTTYNFPKYNKEDIINTLNNSQTYFYRVVGYCAYHKRYITKQQLNSKSCTVKQCNRFIKLKHKFWYDKELKACFKKLKKLKIVI